MMKNCQQLAKHELSKLRFRNLRVPWVAEFNASSPVGPRRLACFSTYPELASQNQKSAITIVAITIIVTIFTISPLLVLLFLQLLFLLFPFLRPAQAKLKNAL